MDSDQNLSLLEQGKAAARKGAAAPLESTPNHDTTVDFQVTKADATVAVGTEHRFKRWSLAAKAYWRKTFGKDGGTESGVNGQIKF